MSQVGALTLSGAKLNVRDSLIKRIENVRRTGLADEIIIEISGTKVNDIIKYDIDVLVVDLTGEGNSITLRTTVM